MNLVAAVVVTYNRLSLLKQCVEAILDQQNAKCDILLVDNASTDGTDQWAKMITQQYSSIMYQNTGENIGGAGGFNYGMRWAVEAGYEYIWIMDDDCIPSQTALKEFLMQDLELNGEYGWLSSRVLWTDGKECPMNLQRKSPYCDISVRHDAVRQQAVMASFVSLFIRRSVVLEYGLPIKEFFIWSDDWEYTRRVSRQRHCYLVNGSVVTHAMQQRSVANIATDRPERVERYRYFYRNDVYLYRREGVKGWLWLLAKNCWHSVQIITCSPKEKFRKVLMIWQGFMQGVRFFPPIEWPDARTNNENKDL